MDALTALLTRRSVKAAELADPAPDDKQLQHILTAGTRVPDHGKLAPWRIRVLHKAGQAALAERVAEAFARQHPDATDKQLAFEKQQMLRAPLLLVVLFTPLESHIPLWEQQLSVGAVCMNLIHATHAQGFAANWLTEWPAYSAEIAQALGAESKDSIAGFIYIGTPTTKPDDRPRPELNVVATEWVG